MLFWLGGRILVTAQPAAEPFEPGLIVVARDSAREVAFTVATPQVALKPTESIHPQLQPEFQAEWTGWLQVPKDGDYAFQHAGQLWLEDKVDSGAPSTLTAGPHRLRMVLERKAGAVQVLLRWQSDSFPWEPVPSSALGHREAPARLLTDLRMESGRSWLEELNCTACHAADTALVRRWYGPTLTGIGSRVSTPWLFHWLTNPKRFHPNAVMPVLLSQSQDVADVAAYLSTLRVPSNAPSTTPAAPEPARLQKGRELYETIGCTACHTKTEWPLEGQGSKHSSATLAQYLMDPLAIDPSGRMPEVILTRDEAQQIAEHLAASRNPEFETPAPAGNPQRGLDLVRSSGCLNCHTLEAGGKIETTLTTLPLSQLKTPRGCLATQPEGKAARYALSTEQIHALSAFLERPNLSAAPIQDLQQSLSFFRCTACHSFHQPARAYFERPPPPLTESGHKLRPDWLEQVFFQKKRIRPWLGLRMPHYGETNLRPVIPWLLASGGSVPGENEALPQGTPAQIEAGIKLIGRSEGSLSCISCHDFRGRKSGAEIRGPDMVEMRDRLRPEWTRRWLLDPARHVPGTAMPSFFMEMPHDQAEKVIEQLLRTLGAGPDMPDPVGLAPPVTKDYSFQPTIPRATDWVGRGFPRG